MDLFGWQLDTWWEWAIVLGSVIGVDITIFAIFGDFLLLYILLSVLTKGKGGSFKGGGGRSGGGGANGSW